MSTINYYLTGIVATSNLDGYTQPYAQNITFAQGDDGYIYISVFDGSLNAVNIMSGGTILTVRDPYNPGVAVISREAIPTSNNDGYFIIGSFDTDMTARPYTYDIVFVDALGNQSHIVPNSVFSVVTSQYQGQPVTVPPAQQPLAGPGFAHKGDLLTYTGSGLSVLDGASAVDGYVVTYDSTQPNGLKWAAASVESTGSSANDVSVGTSLVTLATYTPPAQSNYIILVYYRVTNATTAVTITLTYTDGSGAETSHLVPGTSQPVGLYTIVPTYINSTPNPITITAQSGTSGNLFVSANIVEV